MTRMPRLLLALVLIAALGTACADEPDPAIPDEVRRSIGLVEPEISLFDDLFGEPYYTASTLEYCMEDDLYDGCSYAVSRDEVDLDDLRRQLEAIGWDMFAGVDEFASSSTSIRGSTRRSDDHIDIRVSFHDSDSRQPSLSVSLLFRSLALELC
jgi:hypothetical protein